jgi:hypothetical protein
MQEQILDQQFSNLITRAIRDPYFDLEHALCVAMESEMQQTLSFPSTIAKLFVWPSEEQSLCLHRAEWDHVHVFDTDQKKMISIESSDPMILPMDRGDRVVILNERASAYLSILELENTLALFDEESNDTLEQELRLRAQVNARGDVHVSPRYFVVSVLQA